MVLNNPNKVILTVPRVFYPAFRGIIIRGVERSDREKSNGSCEKKDSSGRGDYQHAG